MTDTGQTISRRLTGGMLLFAASFLLYSLAAPGNLPGDTELRWSVARQIVRGRGFSLEDSVETRNFAVGADGKRYAVSGIGQSLCLVPFTALGLLLEKAGPLGADIADLTAQFLTSLVLFPAIGAAGVWVFYRLALLLGSSRRISLVAAALLGCATMYFHYSVNTQEQSQTALLLTAAILFILLYRQRRRSIYAWLFCAVLGMCLLFRPSSAPEVLAIYLVAVAGDMSAPEATALRKRLLNWFAASICGLGGFIVIVGWYNYVRFGSVFELGYGPSASTSLGGHRLFESSPLPTLAAMLFSPGKSIILYNPVILLSVLGVLGFCRRHKLLALVIFPAVVVNLVFHSFFTAWAGDYAWSVRYQVPMLPFLILPIVVLLSRPMKAVMKALVVSLVSISCVIQVASVVYNFNLEFSQNPNHCIIPDGWVWDWPQSHLRKRFENIAAHIAGRRDFSSVPVAHEEPLLLKYNRSEQSVRNAYRVNFFPFKAAGAPASARLFYPLLCLWVVLLMGFCLVTLRLIKCCLGCRAESG